MFRDRNCVLIRSRNSGSSSMINSFIGRAITVPVLLYRDTREANSLGCVPWIDASSMIDALPSFPGKTQNSNSNPRGPQEKSSHDSPKWLGLVPPHLQPPSVRSLKSVYGIALTGRVLVWVQLVASQKSTRQPLISAGSRTPLLHRHRRDRFCPSVFDHIGIDLSHAYVADTMTKLSL